jgi:hypothetical protein
MALECIYSSIIQGSNQCKKSIGGIRKSWGADWNDIQSVTGNASTGTITAVTMKGGKTLSVLEYDDDNTASYNQTTTRQGLDARIGQVATLKFTGANSTNTVKANKAKGVLKGLWFHLLNDGTIMSQGAEFNGAGDAVVASTVGAKVNPNINSNNGEGSSDITYNIESTSTDAIPCATNVNEAYLDALSDES